jgi:hypothetical protein
MNTSSPKIGIATEMIPRTSPVVAVIRPGASAFGSFPPLTPNTMALIPTARETADQIETPRHRVTARNDPSPLAGASTPRGLVSTE